MRVGWGRRPREKNSVCMYIKSPYIHALADCRWKKKKKEILSILRIRYVKKFPVSSDWLKIPCRAALMKIKYI